MFPAGQRVGQGSARGGERPLSPGPPHASVSLCEGCAGLEREGQAREGALHVECPTAHTRWSRPTYVFLDGVGQWALGVRVGGRAGESLSAVPGVGTARQDAGHTVAAAGVTLGRPQDGGLPTSRGPGEAGTLGAFQATQRAREAGVRAQEQILEGGWVQGQSGLAARTPHSWC